MVAYLQAIFERRERDARQCQDLFQILRGISNTDGSPRYDVNTIAGMFISLMFAGHHTTSTTSSWALLELLRHPEWLARVREELDALYADEREVSYQGAARDPAAGELLQGDPAHPSAAHPPDAQGRRAAVRLQRLVDPGRHERGVSIAVSNRDPALFRDPARFDPTRYLGDDGAADKHLFGWIPFGAGRHRCVGAPFAMMQVKAIFSILLRRYDFELAQPSDTYHEDHSKMVVQLKQPCRVRYRRRH